MPERNSEYAEFRKGKRIVLSMKISCNYSREREIHKGRRGPELGNVQVEKEHLPEVHR